MPRLMSHDRLNEIRMELMGPKIRDPGMVVGDLLSHIDAQNEDLKAKDAIIGHALAWQHWTDYIGFEGPLPEHSEKLYRACQKFRELAEKAKGEGDE